VKAAFFQLLVNVVCASGLGALLAQASKRILIVVAAIVLAYFGLASLIAMNKNDKGHELFQQHHYAEAAQACHQAALWRRAALRPRQADEDDEYCARTQ